MACLCQRCRPSPVTLATVAPRLARARDAAEHERARARAHRRWKRNREMHLERLVGHRDLQLARAYSTGDGDYIERRRRKLAAAERMLAELRAAA